MVEEKLLGKAKYHWFVYVKLFFGFLILLLPVILAVINDYGLDEILDLF